MDNGRVQKFQVKETNLGMAAGAEGQDFGIVMQTTPEQTPVSSARARAEQLGWRVLTGSQEAAQEIARDQAELERPEEFVGVETPLQVDERLAREQENSQNEINPKRDFEARIARRGEVAIAQAAMKEVEEITRKKNFSPLEVVRAYRKLGNEALNSMEDPHPIGRGNG